MIVKTYFMFVFMTLVSCVGPKSQISHTNSTIYPAHTASATSNESIYFINFGTKKVDNNDSCFVINTIEVDGKLNALNSEHTDEVLRNYYNCKVYDSNDKLVFEEAIVNPLEHRVDLYNENGKIESKELSIKSAEFSIRFQQSKPRASRVVVEKIIDKSIVEICKSNLK
jgi:hypothetical protein